MGKNSSSPPPAPAATSTASEQSAANQAAVFQSQNANAVNLYGPQGSVTYGYTGSGDNRRVKSQTVKLTPTADQTYKTQEQIALELSQRAQSAIAGAPTDPFTLNGVPYDPRNIDTSGLTSFAANSYARPGGDGSAVGEAGTDVWSLPSDPANIPYDPRSYGDVNAISDKTAQATYDNSLRLLQPQFDTQQKRLEQNLHDRGLPVGGEASGQAWGDLYRAQNESLSGLALQSTLAGQAESRADIATEQNLRNTAFNEALQSHGTAQSDFLTKTNLEQGIRGQVIGEDGMVRNTSINDASLYLNGAPAINMPTAPQMQQYQIAAAPIADLRAQEWAGQQSIWNAQQQQNASMWQGVGNAAGAGVQLAMMSSEAFKEDIGEADAFLKRVEKMPIKSWRYTEEVARLNGLDTHKHIGPIAEKWASVFGGPTDRIHLGDALFILWKGVQELSARVDRLEPAHV